MDANSQWLWNSPKPVGNPINDIKFINDNTGFLAGDCGTVLRTTNGGLTWEIQKTNTVKDIQSIFFLNNNTGYACGEYNTFLKTTNGGNDWTNILDSAQSFWYSVYFINSSTGFLGGSPDLLKRTTNGGLNWILVSNVYSTVLDIYFMDNNTGWTFGASGTIYKTSDGGNNWLVQPSPANYDYYSGSFGSNNTGWIIGNNLGGAYPFNALVKTTNGGINWYSQIFRENLAIFQINFINDFTGYGIGYISNPDSIYSVIQKTIDGGDNWSTYKIFDKMLMNTFAKTNNAFWAGGRNIFKSSNEGLNWSRITEGFINSILGMKIFPSNNSIYISGVNGLFARSTNNGTNWVENSINNCEYLSMMFFLNSNLGWAAGFGGVYKTTNAGTNWIFYNIPDEQLIKPFFINENTGWVTSYGPNSVFKTTNGGLNWLNLSSIVANSAHTIHFINESTGFVGDIWGKIYKTENGGNNWRAFDTGTGNWIADFEFLNDFTGFAFGEQHSIWKTTNAGESWDSIYNRMYGSFYDATFIRDGINSPNIGYAVGSYMALYRTSNAGLNWYPMVSPTSNNLYQVEFFNNYTGFIIGTSGTILYTTNGGSTFVYNTSNHIPDKHFLHQNFPNPFNNSTIISFELQKNNFVKIIIYNVLGEEIETITNDFYKAGSYSLTVWTGDFPSGVYFYRMVTDGFSETKKMILIK